MITAAYDEEADWQRDLERQAGVLSRGQALAGGMTPGQWHWKTMSGRWQSPHPGVAVTHSGPITDVQRMLAALLWCGRGAALSGDAALIARGFRGLELTTVDVAIPVDRVVAPRPGVRPRRVTGLAPLVQPRRDPRQVRLPRAVLDAVAWASSDRAGEWRLAAAVQQRLVTPQELHAARTQAPRLKRRGLVGAVLLDVELGAHAQTELDLIRLCRRNDLPPPDELQIRVRAGGTRFLDAGWRKRRVVAEIDGAHHRAAGTWDADTLRANEVQVARRHDRVIFLRFTGSNLRHDEPAVVRQLSAVLLD